MSVYIIEDDATLRAELSRLLELNGYEVTMCDDFARASISACEQDFDCVLLDLGLPDADGLEICRDIRGSSDVPIIVLTSNTSEFNEVMSLKLGATDFVAKPYRAAALIARIDALLERTKSIASQSRTLSCAGASLDLSTMRASYGDSNVELSHNEMCILALLMRRCQEVVTRQEIMCELWESDAFIDDNTLTVNVNRLRSKLKSIGVPDSFIQTKRSHGYMVGADG